MAQVHEVRVGDGVGTLCLLDNNAAVTTPVVCELFVAEASPHTEKTVPNVPKIPCVISGTIFQRV